jgi:signal transduction histidine kinase
MQLVRRPHERPIFVSVARDASERQKIDRMKSEFISTVSHELRTPLTSIRGSLGLVVGGAVGPVNESTLKLIGIAYTNSERLVRLINDILDIEKFESGSMRFDLQPHTVHSLLEQAVDTNRAYGEQLGVRLHLSPDSPDVLVNVDPDRFQQIMSNLLSNACKFSAAGAAVEIAAKLDGNALRISVSDDGPGIPLEFRSKIFGKFSQADSSDTRQKNGTGLGLSIVKAMVEKHNGSVTFDSTVGVGTTFHLTLPVAPARAFTSAATAAPPIALEADQRPCL